MPFAPLQFAEERLMAKVNLAWPTLLVLVFLSPQMRSLHLGWFFFEPPLKQSVPLLRELFGKTPYGSVTFSSGHSPVQTTKWMRVILLTRDTLMNLGLQKILLKTDGNIWQLPILLNSGFFPTPVACFPMFQDLGIGDGSLH